ncbi:MAG: hypothetical protein WCK98_00950 [bacterium]
MAKNEYKLEGQIPVQIKPVENGFVAICYPLNLVTQGDTKEEARSMFQEMLGIFLQDLVESGNLESVLIEAGFSVEIRQKGSPVKFIVAPETTNIKLPSLA